MAEKITQVDRIKDRILPNIEVKESGFDAQETVKFLEELYDKCINEREIN